jgi:type IV secretion system protein VirB9
MAPVLLSLSTPAMAEDNRLVDHAFNDNEVVRIEGKTGVQATIAFGKNEAIENVAVGDSQKWQITPNKRADLLFVKPLESSARTNMTVVTNRHTYFFDLVASPRAKPLYMLRFTYKDEPQDDTAPGAKGLEALDPAERALAAGDALAVPADPAALNFAWKRTGSTKLQPARIYDDGEQTYLLWADRSAVPAILIKNEKGEEGPVNYSVRGQAIVLAEVPKLIILRSGKASAELENMAEDEIRGPATVAANTPDAASSAANSKGN